MTTLSRERVQNYRAWCAARVGQLSGADIGVALCDSWLATDVGEVKRYYPIIEGIDDVRACMVWDEKGIVTCTFVKSEAYDALAAAHRAAVSERDEYKSAWEDDNRDLCKALLERDAAYEALRRAEQEITADKGGRVWTCLQVIRAALPNGSSHEPR